MKKIQWAKIEPGVVGEVEQIYSKQRRTLTFDSIWRGCAQALWAGSGRVSFDLATGRGKDVVADWSLTLDTARLILASPEHEFSAFSVVLRKRAEKDQERQMDLFKR